MPFNVVSHPLFSPLCIVGLALLGGNGEASEDSAVTFFSSISPTLILRCLTWLDIFGGSSESGLTGGVGLIRKGDCCSTRTKESSLAAWDMEGCIGGNGFVVSDVPRLLVNTSAIGDVLSEGAFRGGGTGGVKAPINDGVPQVVSVLGTGWFDDSVD